MFNHRFFVKNTFLSLLGQTAPLLGAFFAIPHLLGILGNDKFGILALSWGIVGYFSLFDLGLGRALTQRVAVQIERNEHSILPSTIWSALILLFTVGILGALIAYALAPWIVFSILKVPKDLTEQTLIVFKLIALSIPVVVLSSGLRGLLEGLGKFAILNWIRIPIGVLTFILPLTVSYFITELGWVVASLLILRLVGLVIQWKMCIQVLPSLQTLSSFESIQFKQLLKFGGWMTVSNFVAPLMVYLDRFLIGSLVSLSAIASYVVPFEVVTKLWIVSAAITSVLFPGFSAAYLQSRDNLALVFSLGIKLTFILLIPISVPMLFISPELLQLWLGKPALPESVSVVKWISIGVLINSYAQVCFALVQGVGRPDLTAKLHLLEFPIYIVLLYYLTSLWGVEGSAIAWSVRVGIDALLLSAISLRFVSFLPSVSLRLVIPLIYVLVICICSLIVEDTTIRWIFLLLYEISTCIISWFFILGDTDRKTCLSWVGKLKL